MVAVATAAIAEEEVNTPPDAIVPALAGLTDQVTTWLGLYAPATVAEQEEVPPAEMVVGVQLGVTKVTVVVVLPLVLPLVPPEVQPVMVTTPLRQANSPSAIDNTNDRCKSCLLRITFSFFRSILLS